MLNRAGDGVLLLRALAWIRPHTGGWSGYIGYLGRGFCVGPIYYVEPIRQVTTGHRRMSCLGSASDVLAQFGMTACRSSLPTERHDSISVDADNKPLLRAHDHDVLR
jgi:hypothetical protein